MAFYHFQGQFFTVPAGKLPVTAVHPDGIEVPAFEAMNAVTVTEWNRVMVGTGHEKIDQMICPNCPVTKVAYEEKKVVGGVETIVPAEIQHYLERKNAEAARNGSSCSYDLPTDDQLLYLIRGDKSGTNTDLYSTGVTADNVNEYVTYYGNSMGGPRGANRQIQPVGIRKLNAFGFELGNVWKISKTVYDPAYPNWGRSVRGGSWSYDVSDAESSIRFDAFVGFRDDDLGFSLVRRCR